MFNSFIMFAVVAFFVVVLMVIGKDDDFWDQE